MTSLDAHPSSTETRTRSIWRAGAFAAVLAALANTAVYLVGLLTPAGWEVLQAGSTQQVPVIGPALGSLVGVAVGTVALWVLRRFSWGPTLWTVAAVVVGLGSIPAPLQAATDVWTGVLLATMHVVVLLVALVVLRPAGRRST